MHRREEHHGDVATKRYLALISSFQGFVGEIEMKTIRGFVFCLVALFLTAPLLRAQDLSKYRDFSFGMSLASVLKHTDQRMSDVKVIHQHPALMQEVTWWPPNIPGPKFQSDTVAQILFSFCNGELYQIAAMYDQSSTEGLTAEDMVKSISAKYGAATNVVLENDSAKNDRYNTRQKPVATWEDAQYSFNLVRSSFSGDFELVIYSKRANAEAGLATAEAVKLEEQEGPQKEAARQKKQTDDLETARLKNQKAFRP